MSCQNLCAYCQKLSYGSLSMLHCHCVSVSHLGLGCRGNHSSVNMRSLPLAQSTDGTALQPAFHKALSHSAFLEWLMWMFEALKRHIIPSINNHIQLDYYSWFYFAQTGGRNCSAQDPLCNVRYPIACHTTPPGSLCSPVMRPLKWKRVIEWDNLKTQGLGLLLATVFSEERRFSHCLLSPFLRANTQTLTCTQKYVNPFWKQGTYSDTHTATLPTSQAIGNKYWTVHSPLKENQYALYKTE